MLSTVVASSWADLQEILYGDSWDDRIGRHRSSWAYRGMVNSDWGLDNSLQRMGVHHREVERHLLRNYRKYAHAFMQDLPSAWHWMTVGQHHGLPTRLLDWTWSPLVGLHFATDHYPPQHDAVVWRVHVEDCHVQCPKLLREALEREGSMVFTVETLSVVTKSLLTSRSPGVTSWSEIELFDSLFDSAGVVFFEPESIDQRVVNQYALFSVMPTQHRSLTEFAEAADVRAERIIIPRDLCTVVRDYLDGSNINERVMYPGPDGLATWLKRHYHGTDVSGSGDAGVSGG